MEITVNGEHYVEVEPEFARVQFSVSMEGQDRQRVSTTVSELANRLSGALKESSARNTYSQPLRIHSWVIKNRTNHSASVSLSAEFTDVGELAEFQARWAGIEGVEYGGVSWRLSEETELSKEAEVLAGALKNAQRRARFIADAADMGSLSILQISDPGLMSMEAASFGHAWMSADNDSAEAVDINPEKVRVSARLEVRFRAE